MPQGIPAGRNDFAGSDKPLYIGRIIAYYAGYNFYHVVLAQGGPLRKARPAGGTGGVGVAKAHILPSGTTVVLTDTMGTAQVSTGATTLEIVGSLASLGANQAFSFVDTHDLISGAGYLFDKLHSFLPDQRTNDVEPAPFGTGVPMDSLAGEDGSYGPLGPAWFVALAMACMRASDRCGIWMFRLDEHMRVVAKSLESQTMAKETQELYDDGEISVIERIAFVPWEALGAFSNGIPTGTLSTQSFVDPGSPPSEQFVKTFEVNQRSIQRLLDIKGYLGDIKDSFVSLPVSPGTVDTYALNSSTYFQGVHREVVGADGMHWLQSAKGIHLEKYLGIQLPQALTTPDDPAGDNPTNYKASNAFGAGPTQTRKDFNAPSDTFTGDRGLLGLELHGAWLSKASFQTLRSHTKDWTVQDEPNVPLSKNLGGSLYNAANGFALSPKTMWMKAPPFQAVAIQNGRWEGVRFYTGRSAIDMWDDGSVCVEDAWGAQFILSGGNLILTAPNDIILAPGRNLTALAPQDINLRAGNSADITATRRDVRIKAERNLMAIGGNSGQGGILLESRDNGGSYDYQSPGQGTNISGLVLKNTNGTVALVSEAISLIAAGSIFTNSQGIAILTTTFHVEASTHAEIIAGDSSGNASGALPSLVTYYFGPDKMDLGAGPQSGVPISLRGEIQAAFGLSTQGSIFAGNSVDVNGSLSVSGDLGSPTGDVNKLGGAIVAQLATQLRTNNGTLASTKAALFALLTTTRKFITTSIAAVGQYFNPVEIATKVAGSLRVDADYLTDGAGGFQIPEFRWQEYAAGNGSPKVWVEKPVGGPGGTPTVPYPGTAWTQPNMEQLQYSSYNTFSGYSQPNATDKAPVVTWVAPSTAYITNSLES
jgi:hypothetical protein